MTADLQSLIERVERATGPDRDIDYDLLPLVGARAEIFKAKPFSELTGGLEFAVWPDGRRTGIPPFTASIDVALNLVNEAMPGAHYDLRTASHRKGMRANIWYSTVHTGDAPTLPLAILLALLRAMKAREEATS